MATTGRDLMTPSATSGAAGTSRPAAVQLAAARSVSGRNPERARRSGDYSIKPAS